MRPYQLLKRGYFPEELPPVFSTLDYSAAMHRNRNALPASFSPNANKIDRPWTEPARHNIARPGTLRRELSVPTPEWFFVTANEIASNWRRIAGHCRKSPYSITNPIIGRLPGRAVQFRDGISRIVAKRVESRRGANYVVVTDVQNYYRSIYTHTIPWALSGKAVSKAAVGTPTKVFGDDLDKFVRGGQSGQTMGIPVSPDTSYVISEAILSSLDTDINVPHPDWGLRYMDNYEFGCGNYGEARQLLADLQGLFAEYSLSLNPDKSDIIELSIPLEDVNISQIRRARIRDGVEDEPEDLVILFSLAFQLFQEKPEDRILQYTVLRLRDRRVRESSWPVLEGLLLQAGVTVPGCLPHVVEEIHAYIEGGYNIDVDSVERSVEAIIELHAPQQHGSEVCWALWLAVVAGVGLSENATKAVAKTSDPFAAMLALKVNELDLMHATFEPTLWASKMEAEELRTHWWPLAYEALMHAWLPSIRGGNYLTNDPVFGLLESESVHFLPWNGPRLPASRFPLSGRKGMAEPIVEEVLDDEESYSIERALGGAFRSIYF